jgi:nicotinate phosphoribosyltransferase
MTNSTDFYTDNFYHPAPLESPVELGPYREDGMITAGMDYYKPTMSQVLHECEPDAEVTFTFKNRRSEQRLAEYVDPANLQDRFDMLQARGFSEDEIDYFGSIKKMDGTPVFEASYLEFLRQNDLPPVSVTLDSETNDLAIETTGPAALVTFWETVVMSEVNEAYFENYVLAHGIDIMSLYDEGDQRLTNKIDVLKEHPEIKFSDFGTRRHFSMRWQRHVVQRLKAECPDNIAGTSNVALANTLGMKPIGTFAHEMPMVWAGLADARGEDILDAHNKMLQAWEQTYSPDYMTALTDTFGSDFFFRDFTPEQARSWNALRHDSGDPYDFGEKVITFYENLGIDPSTKTIVFSDGLDLDTIVKLNAHFSDRINTTYGWGTTLTNDLGLPALNIVMKATHVRLPDGREAGTVKLSDNEGKHTGTAEDVEKYQREINERDYALAA